MATNAENSKKILCCSGAAIQKAVNDSVNSTLAAAYWSASAALTDAIKLLTDIPIIFPPTTSDSEDKVILASSAVCDAMGVKAGEEVEFTTNEQSAIDDFVSAAEAIFLVK